MRVLFVLLLMLMIRPLAFSQQRDTIVSRDSVKNVLRVPSRPDTAKPATTRRDTAINPVIITGDTVINGVKKDSVRKHSPRKAAIRSAIVPGLGQIYNRKYWKLPLVYAAIGIPAYLVYYNKQWYDRSRYALSVASNPPIDSMVLLTVHPDLRAITKAGSVNALRSYRDEFRKNMDYSILITILAWGLNVIDATVDAHLKGFDVSDEISMRVKPVILSGTNTAGLSFVFSLNNKSQKRQYKPLY